MSSTADSAVDARPGSAPKRDRTHFLYIAVIVAMVAGMVPGGGEPSRGGGGWPWVLSDLKSLLETGKRMPV